MVLLLKMLLKTQNLLVFFFFFLAFAGFLNAQKAGFLSIDCGIPQGSNYTDDTTGIFYISDAGFIDAGENKEIQASDKYASLARQFYNVRSFPEGDRNCYTLRPVVKGNKYLVRGSFMYGNYDGEDVMPKFDLYLGVNLWASINQANGSRPGWTEIILIATADYIPVCLVKKTGNPYISALELRLIDSAMYNATDDVTTALVLYNRYDLGSATKRILRYGDDVYDRIWSPISSNSWTILSTPSTVKNVYKVFQPPPAVMNTAVAPVNGSDTLFFNWTADSGNEKYVVYRHFAELSVLEGGQVREFGVCVVGFEGSCINQFRPSYLVADTIYTVTPFDGRIQYSCSFTKTNASTLPPILNAIEIYIVTTLSETATNEKDVDAIMDFKSTYQLERNWMGDPCVPQNYSWEGIGCSYQGPYPPTIVSLNLSSSKLKGPIAPSIQNLTSLESLDLSGNNLTGEVPSFLATLQSLRLLNLSGNLLNGSVPPALLERTKIGSLLLSIDNNPHLCTSEPCNNSDSCTTNPCELKKKKKKTGQIVAPVVVVVSLVTVALLVVAFIYWRKRGNRTPKATTSVSNGNEVGGSFNLENRRFTFAEIVTMTNNFQTILGKGGFGIVYYGQMNEGIQVAVKMLSQTSQGSNEFQIEAQLLMRVYHRNLVQFIGYCAEGNKMALVLEYMSEGNLAKVLSVESNQNPLNWGQRLRIALDVAQGLEYLHTGCKPHIIHRDVKGTNILLNEKLEAKIADFGLSKVFHDDNFTHVSTAVKGTHGYLDPEYCITNNLNEKSDVYSFGIVLMELITGQPAIVQTSDSERISIIDWARPLISRGDIRNVVDERLQGIYDTNSAWKVIEIAISCTPHKSIQRPTMSNVVAELKACLGVQSDVPKSVSFIREESLSHGTDNSIFHPTAR